MPGVIVVPMKPELTIPKGTKPLSLQDVQKAAWCLTNAGGYLALEPERIAQTVLLLEQAKALMSAALNDDDCRGPWNIEAEAWLKVCR